MSDDRDRLPSLDDLDARLKSARGADRSEKEADGKINAGAASGAGQGFRIAIEMVAALGASPVAMGFKDVYTNLYTGALDGAENNVPSYRSERHFEVAKYYSYDRHSTIPDLLMINAAVWNRLSSEEQTALRQAARDSSRAQREFWQAYVGEALATVREAGCEVNEIDDLAAFQQAVQPLYEQYGDLYGDLVERIRAVE